MLSSALCPPLRSLIYNVKWLSFELCAWLVSLILQCPELCPGAGLSALSLQSSVSLALNLSSLWNLGVAPLPW